MPYLLLILSIAMAISQPLMASAESDARHALNSTSDNTPGNTFEVIQFRESRHEQAPAIDVRFSAPVLDARGINDVVYLVNEQTGRVAGEWLVSEAGRKLTFPFVEPDTGYELKILGSLRSTAGMSVSYPESLTLRTRPLAPVASFASSGFVLARSSRRGLPVSVVNVDAVDIDFFRVDDVAGFMKSGISAGKVGDYRLRSLTRIATLIHSARFEINPKKNQRTVTNVDITRVKALDQPGLIIAVLQGAGHYEAQSSVIYYSVSNIGLHARRYRDHFDVYLHSIDKGRILDGVQVTLFDRNGEAGFSAKTDGEGRARIPVTPNAGFLVARHGQQTTLLAVDRGALDLSEFRNARSIHTDLQTFSWGPRDLYRPGELVRINLLLRDHDGRRVNDIPVSVEVLRPDGQQAVDTLLQPSGAGFYSLDYRVPRSAATGQWQVRYRLGEELRLPQGYSFNVEEFHPQRLRLDVMPGRKDIPTLMHAAEIAIPVQGDYLFGAPASGHRVDGQVTIGFARHPFPSLPNYFFGIDGEQINLPRSSLAAIFLDKTGAGTLQLPDRWAGLNSPLRASLTVSLYESGGRAVNGRRDLILLRDTNHVGIDPLFNERPAANSQLDFSFAAVDARGDPRPGTRLDVTLVREDRSWFWSYGSHRGWYWDYNAAPYNAWSGQVTAGADGRASLSIPVDAGYYRLRVTDSDGATTDFSFETAGRWWHNVTRDNNAPATIFLGLDRDAYIRGDTAKLSWVSPHTGSALLTVESSAGELYRESIEITDTTGTLDLAIDPLWDRHDLHVSLMIIKPSDDHDTVSPQRAFGLVYLPITRPDFDIKLDLDAPEKLRPGQTVSARVQVDPTALHSTTYVVAALVDVGILNLTRFATPRPEQWFHAPRRYQVDLYDMYGDIIENKGLGRIRQKFGGGAGDDFGDQDAALNPGTTRDPAELELVAFSSTPVALDPSGNADISFDIPDFDGRMKWMVVAFSDDQFGSTDAYTTVASPVVVQLSHPRYLSPGDKSLVAVDVTNLSGQPQDLELTLEQGGGLIGNDTTRELVLADGARQTFTMDLRADDLMPGLLTLQLTNEAGDLSLTRETRLPIHSPYPAVTRIERVLLPAGEIWLPSIQIDDLRAETRRARLTLSRYPAIDVSGQMSALLNYPYGCLEQIISRAQPWLTINASMIEHFGATEIVRKRFDAPFSETLRREQLALAVKALQSMQKPGGGFSSWDANGPESPWLTVYATDFLTRAAKLGVVIPRGMLQSALGRVLALVRTPGLRQSFVADQAQYDFAVGAYGSFVLARASRISLSDVRRLFNGSSGELNHSGLPWMHLGLALHLLGDTERSSAALARVTRGTRDRNQYAGDYGSPLRDVAWILRYLAEYDVDVPVDLLDLAEAHRDRRWLSTQERTHLLGLAAAWQANGERVSATLDLAGGPRQIEQAGPWAKVISEHEMDSLRGVMPNGEPLYAEFAVAGVPSDAPAPVNHDMTVSKAYFNVDGSAASVDRLTTGDLVVVRLQITADENIPDAIVVDLLPAGIELENQNLLASSLDLTAMTFDDDGTRFTPNHQVAHEEFREDRYVAALELTAGRMERVFYLARVVTPGSYTVPPAYAEDMYRPWRFSIGKTRQMSVSKP